MDSKLYEKIKEILGYENSSVTTSVQQVAFDLAAIYTKMDGLLYPCYIPEGTHSFQSDIIQNNIICIYRQVLTTPLSEIEAQVDMQITTIANNIMLRRLSESTKIGEDRETIAMAAHILSQ